MCGRFALFAPLEALIEYFGLSEAPAYDLALRYNIAPGQPVPIVRERRDGGGRELVAARWGLVPFWAKDPTIGHRLVNARLDSVAEKPAFREAWTRRRCLLPASGFYEWAGPERGRGPRQPFFLQPRGVPLLALAGLWERWRAPDGSTLETCVVVTTDANDALARIHDRMPLLVPRGSEAVWLDPRTSVADAAALAAQSPEVAAWPVSTAVNDARRDDETMVMPLRELL